MTCNVMCALRQDNRRSIWQPESVTLSLSAVCCYMELTSNLPTKYVDCIQRCCCQVWLWWSAWVFLLQVPSSLILKSLCSKPSPSLTYILTTWAAISPSMLYNHIIFSPSMVYNHIYYYIIPTDVKLIQTKTQYYTLNSCFYVIYLDQEPIKEVIDVFNEALSFNLTFVFACRMASALRTLL